MKTPDAADVVSPEEWKQAREEMLVKEKEYMRAGDALAAERRRMPWLAVEKDYEFVGPDGKMSFEDLFRAGASWSSIAPSTTRRHDHVERRTRSGLRGLLLHGRPDRSPRPPGRPRHRAGLRLGAPQAQIQACKERMGWSTSPGTR